MEGLLEEELYDVVASLAESFYVEASNASWDWQTGEITPEVVGQVVDVQSTVAALMKPPPRSEVRLVTVVVLPSITRAHFQPYYRGPAASRAWPSCSMWTGAMSSSQPLLEVLAHADVTVTWFLTGRWAQQSPELARAIAEAGHEIGNHGGWHGLPSEMSRDEVARLIQEGEDLILGGHRASGPRCLRRRPGDFTEETVAVAAEMGYKTVLWTVDTVDWQRPAPTRIIDRVLSGLVNGALILMHPTQPTLKPCL